MKIENDIIITALKEILSGCSTVERAALFGSRARGDNKERSDYDVAIFGAVSEDDKLEISLKAEDIPTLLRIHIAYVNDLGSGLILDNIKNEGITFYDGREIYVIDCFGNMLKRLNEANVVYKKSKNDDICRDALIKRFEFTFELAWKCLKEYLIYNGVTVRDTPRDILKTAYQKGLINNERVWLAMMEARNLTAHIYKEAQALAIAEDISVKFCKELSMLKALFEDF